MWYDTQDQLKTRLMQLGRAPDEADAGIRLVIEYRNAMEEIRSTATWFYVLRSPIGILHVRSTSDNSFDVQMSEEVTRCTTTMLKLSCGNW